MRVLTVNAGSSSLKLGLVEDGRRVRDETLPVIGGDPDEAAVAAVVGRFGRIEAIGHRIVHGGTEFAAPVRIDPLVRRRIAALTDLAPLHQPRSLFALDLLGRLAPGVPAVAAFDTAFHAGLPPEASTYALPAEWRARWPIRRFGFHGLSHASVSRRAAERIGPTGPTARIVTCHLGSGASLAAVRGGRSIDTTMGFTPLDGLVMGTRSGSVDPGLLLWLERHTGMAAAELATALEERSGLLGLAGTPDMRAVLAAEARGDRTAALAVGVYLHRLRAEIAAMTASLGGLDAVVFTGGIGENSPEIRARAAEGLGFLGVAIAPDRNARPPADGKIDDPTAPVRAFVLPADEDLEIARAAEGVLRG